MRYVIILLLIVFLLFVLFWRSDLFLAVVRRFFDSGVRFNLDDLDSLF